MTGTRSAVDGARPAPTPTDGRPGLGRPYGARLVALTLALFVGPWLFWFSRIAQDRGLIGWHLPQGAALWSMTPLLVLTVGAVAGRGGLRDLAGRLVRWRVPAWTYLAAVAIPLGVGLTAAALVVGSGGDLHLGETLSLPSACVYLAYGTGLFLLTEEAGWRGVLLPRLQERVDPVRAAVVIGVVWAVWHLPLLAVPGESDQGLPLAPFMVLIVSTSVLMSCLVNAASGSVLVAAVFHASFDACYSYLGVVGADHAMLWAAAGVSAAAAVALAMWTRGRLCVSGPTILT
ncbi:MAG: CPBP family intramembrane metalloprotease [Nocardioidaceae bacterium]|nr:CPBP family intramembrane metalloprotease [Nocardioidaceae bacterium]